MRSRRSRRTSPPRRLVRHRQHVHCAHLCVPYFHVVLCPLRMHAHVPHLHIVLCPLHTHAHVPHLHVVLCPLCMHAHVRHTPHDLTPPPAPPHRFLTCSGKRSAHRRLWSLNVRAPLPQQLLPPALAPLRLALFMALPPLAPVSKYKSTVGVWEAGKACGADTVPTTVSRGGGVGVGVHSAHSTMSAAAWTIPLPTQQTRRAAGGRSDSPACSAPSTWSRDLLLPLAATGLFTEITCFR
ncbi:hypothetical protein DFH08DRAFT_968064 [Mycena albidolilacea]|uniref:Uncharacterized protein n=1 Tax=Mycena albidolilacea TaxID=1033008 RepID=A0AAD6ZKL5_9AGAR|nr:hypothetical protein DFH08DRAFT_968064 [Mycena albidolilacea]